MGKNSRAFLILLAGNAAAAAAGFAGSALAGAVSSSFATAGAIVAGITAEFFVIRALL